MGLRESLKETKAFTDRPMLVTEEEKLIDIGEETVPSNADIKVSREIITVTTNHRPDNGYKNDGRSPVPKRSIGPGSVED